VQVPEGAPAGGRCVHAALAGAVALRRRGLDATVACLATDGVDGPGKAAGAVVAAADGGPDAERALASASAQPFLDRRGALVPGAATGTNANDLWVALRR
jgi:glycerate-2-kinase